MGDYDNIINTAKEEAHAAGKAEGLKLGLEQGLEQGIEQGLEQGLSQGLEQGLEQGRIQANLQSAKNLKALGVPAEIIAQGTGLSIDEIEKL
jgi:predicted transposase/invertase (TIGR01784 family)